MDDKKLSKICLAITLCGMILLGLTYHEEFEKKTIYEVTQKEGTKGLVYGRIEYVIKNSPSTQFILTDGNKILVFYPRESDYNKNDFVYVYAESQTSGGKKELYAYKVVKAE